MNKKLTKIIFLDDKRRAKEKEKRTKRIKKIIAHADSLDW